MTHSMVAGQSSGQGPASAEDKQGLRLEVRESETWMCVQAAWRSPPAPISEVLGPLCPGLMGHEGNMSKMPVLGGRRGSEEGVPSYESSEESALRLGSSPSTRAQNWL